MANGSQPPSECEKIQGKFYHVPRLSSDILHTTKYGLLTSTPYANLGLFQSPLRSSSTIWPNAPTVSAEAPMEKGANGLLNLHLAGMVARTAVAPIERVKLLIQNQNEMLRTGRLSRSYKGITHCFARTMKSEGFLSLWRGNTANILRGFTIMGLDLQYSKDYFMRHFTFTVNKEKGYDHYWNWFARKMASESFVGLSSLFFVYSFDYGYTRLANDVKAAAAYASASGPKCGERQFNGLIDVYKKTFRSDGIAGLYRGFNVSCVGVVLYRGLDLGAHEALRPLVLDGNLQGNFLAGVMLKYGAILGATMACYPFDTVRRRMMMTSGTAIKYKNSWDAFHQIIKNEGANSLFKGFGVRILHTSAVTAAFVVYMYSWLHTDLLLKQIGRSNSKY